MQNNFLGKKIIAVFFLLTCLLFSGLFFTSCTDTSELVDLALDPPKRKPINKAIVGVNNFFVNAQFGSTAEQYRDIRQTLGLRFVRVLFSFVNEFQPTPDTAPRYAFYDQILANIPPGTDVLIVLSHAPDWVGNSANQIENNPRKTWVEKLLRPTIQRYRNAPGVVGWEIWNEPDAVTVPADAALELQNPDKYFEMLVEASNVIRSIDPRRKIVIAAPQSLQQNFPNNLRYSQRLKNLGAESFVDIWNFHYYGKSFETVITPNGVKDFLNSVNHPIWLTESGEQGPNKQLAYAETAWPFLTEKIPGIERIYYYEYGSPADLQTNFGLRTTDPSFPVSDLYVHLSGR